jgi:hypothetical protein
MSRQALVAALNEATRFIARMPQGSVIGVHASPGFSDVVTVQMVDRDLPRWPEPQFTRMNGANFEYRVQVAKNVVALALFPERMEVMDLG